MNLDSLQIETPRLLLRLPRLDDLDAWAAMMTDEEAAKFIGGVAPREVTWRALMTMIGSWHANGFAMFSVIEKSSGRWVGRLGPWMPLGWPGTEVGWAIARECWGRGYAPEGAAAATDWAFDNLGWTDVIHSIDPANIASQPSRASSARAILVPASCRRRFRKRRSTSGASRARNGDRAESCDARIAATSTTIWAIRQEGRHASSHHRRHLRRRPVHRCRRGPVEKPVRHAVAPTRRSRAQPSRPCPDRARRAGSSQGRSEVLARHGIVATSDPLAAEAGLEILRQGGNAIDAAVATGAVLDVTSQNDTGIGGDLFAIVYSAKDKKLYALNSGGWAPTRLDAGVLHRHAQADARAPITASTPRRCPARSPATTRCSRASAR